MGISKRHIDTNQETIRFSVEAFGAALKKALLEVRFAYLMGSSADGVVKPHSDVDLALYLEAEGLAPAPPRESVTFSLYERAAEITDQVIGPVRCDVGILNTAESIYRFEALKGRLLFRRDREEWLRFYSVSSREYEHQLFHYEKQRRYRLQAEGRDSTP